MKNVTDTCVTPFYLLASQSWYWWYGRVRLPVMYCQIKVQLNQITVCCVVYAELSIFSSLEALVVKWKGEWLFMLSLYPTLAAHTSPTNHTCTYMHTHVFTHTCACTHPYPVLGTVLCVCFWFTADTVIWKEEEEKEDQIGGTVTSVRRVYECTFFSVCEQWFPVSLWSYCTYII